MASDKDVIPMLIKKRGSIKSSLTCFIKYLDNLTIDKLSDVERNELEVRLSKIETLHSEFDNLQLQIECSSENPDEQYDERDEFERKFFKAVAVARTRIQKEFGSDISQGTEASSASAKGNNITVNKPFKITLPTITLPKFDGSLNGWLEFRDTFLSLVHQNDAIDSICKFHYLRSCLQGSAAILIGSLELTSVNYPIAWNILYERYDNNRLLVTNYLKSLFDIKVIQNTSKGIRTLIDTYTKSLRSLQGLGEQTEHWGTLLTYMITCKLDPETNKEWEHHRSDKNDSFEELTKFLKNRADILETIESRSQDKGKMQFTPTKPKSFLLSSSGKKVKCYNCQGEHFIYVCSDFLKLTIPDRIQRVNNLKLCLNCLQQGHTEKMCKRSSCRICKLHHNTLLHQNKNTNCYNSVTSEETPNVACPASTTKQFLLSTATINAFGKTNTSKKMRVLLDCGSTSCFITEEAASSLGLDITNVNTHVTGINNIKSTLSKKSSFRIKSIYGTFETCITCYVIPDITGPLPSHTISVRGINIPDNIILADPQFNIPGKIDILFGADIFWQLLKPEQLKIHNYNIMLQDTHLGWIVTGFAQTSKNAQCHYASLDIQDIQEQLHKFWELDSVSEVLPLSENDKLCEDIFINTTQRLPDGRFSVNIPLKDNIDSLGDSFDIAKRRLLTLEKRFNKNHTLFNLYKEFLHEYEDLGHMSIIHDDNYKGVKCYIPHHSILRADSTTTKLRVVFDASAATSNGISLNNIQLVGPTIQDDLFSILLRFRQYPIVVSADIPKMYRQVLINDHQRPLQRILWREDVNNPISIYQLNTITYGTASAPYLATRCLSQLANECKDKAVATIIKHDFYMDDLLTGTDTINEANEICNKIIHELNKGKFQLRKWRSNNETVLQDLTSTDNEKHFLGSSDSKTLGMLWDQIQDIFKFTVKKIDTNISTKRSILASISQIFDPLGLVAPCVMQTKILLQKLWLQKVQWDDGLPFNITQNWIEITKSLINLNNLKIPRQVIISDMQHFEIHIFSDASETAYGACAYARSINSMGNISVKLLCAKGKVAPLKVLTIPRLELCGALTAARLYIKITQALRTKVSKYTFWCDSTIVLAWLKTQPCQLKTFVRNRVSEIQINTSSSTWQYISSNLNPADIISRGINATNIYDNELWWNGPSFLSLEEASWPSTLTTTNSIQLECLPEMKEISLTNSDINNTTGNIIDLIIQRCSTLFKIKRVLAYVLRFTVNARNNNKMYGPLSTKELFKAMSVAIIYIQSKHFSNDLHLLKSKNNLPKSSKLFRLDPFICTNGFLRIRGRLNNSLYTFDTNHPIILPNDLFTIRIFQYEHIQLMHCGPQLLLSNIRQNYWPIGGRNLARKITHNCIICTKLTARIVNPLMGNLPLVRTSPSSPFSVCGIDYAGPIFINSKKGRGAKLIKSYICLFVCFATKAIHLELSTDMTTETFLLALRRFIARRGKPDHIYCDNGSNFIGGCNELKHLFSESFNNDNIEFHFIPPQSPHFGGLWEAGVKSVKHHLKRTVGLAHLTYEELLSVLCQIEAILNSRPITSLSDSPNDFSPLTPGHFLIGRPITALPEAGTQCHDIEHLNRIPRYYRIEEMRKHFWGRWSKEYIHNLQQRVKWHKQQHNIKIGTLVILKEDYLPPLKWRLGRIVDLHYGADGIVRVVSVKTAQGIVKRTLAKICSLMEC